jgi:CubicO group peptidase (beta-lactamase class C family)
MTRGAAVDGPWDIDAVTALPGGQVARVASAPRIDPPGQVFRYDNGAAHLLSAGLAQVVGRPVGEYAAAELFAPLGITDASWLADPDGVSYGYAHLRLSAESLGRLGELWRAGGQPLIDPDFAAAMTAPRTPGGPPEELPYGFGTWVGDGLSLAAGWAGQHVVVLPDAVVVTTGDPRFDAGPPPRDELPRTGDLPSTWCVATCYRRSTRGGSRPRRQPRDVSREPSGGSRSLTQVWACFAERNPPATRTSSPADTARSSASAHC